MTVAGNGAFNTIALRSLIGIVLDADKYLFIVDSANHHPYKMNIFSLVLIFIFNVMKIFQSISYLSI
jgi:hypothetical protein